MKGPGHVRVPNRASESSHCKGGDAQRQTRRCPSRNPLSLHRHQLGDLATTGFLICLNLSSLESRARDKEQGVSRQRREGPGSEKEKEEKSTQGPRLGATGETELGSLETPRGLEVPTASQKRVSEDGQGERLRPRWPPATS